MGCWHDHRRMFLRSHSRSKDGKAHVYWSLVETVRSPDAPGQRTICYLGELNSSAEARWLKTVEVFNEQGEARQLKLFPSHVVPPGRADGGRRLRRNRRSRRPGAERPRRSAARGLARRG